MRVFVRYDVALDFESFVAIVGEDLLGRLLFDRVLIIDCPRIVIPNVDFRVCAILDVTKKYLRILERVYSLLGWFDSGVARFPASVKVLVVAVSR